MYEIFVTTEVLGLQATSAGSHVADSERPSDMKVSCKYTETAVSDQPSVIIKGIVGTSW